MARTTSAPWAEGDAFREEAISMREAIVVEGLKANVLHRVLYQAHANGILIKNKKPKVGITWSIDEAETAILI